MDLVWKRRAARWPLAVTCALALPAYLTLGDLVTPLDTSGGGDTYVWIGGLGVTVFVLVFGWLGFWALALGLPAFAIGYEELLWTKPPGVREGMDYLGYYPSNAVYLLVLLVPWTLLVMLFRVLVSRRAHGPGPVDG